MRVFRKSAWALLLLVLGACSNTTTETEPTATVRGVVRDNFGSTIPNVVLQLYRTGRTARVARSDGSGTFSFRSIESGTWQLEVTVPNGYVLPPIQKNPAPVEIDGGGTVSVTVSLSRKTTTPPPIGGPGISSAN